MEFSVVLGILFSMFFTLGRVLQKHTSLEEFDASDGVGLFLSFVIWSCVFIAFLKCGSVFVDEYRCRKQAGVIWDKNKIFWIAFVLLLWHIYLYIWQLFREFFHMMHHIRYGVYRQDMFIITSLL